MNGQAPEIIPSDSIAVDEKKVWRQARRQRKTLAGQIAGWIGGDMAFLLVFWAGAFLWEGCREMAGSSPLGALPALWKQLCAAAGLDSAVLERGDFWIWSMLAAIPVGLAVNLIFGTAVGLIWPGAGFAPVPGDGTARAEVLRQRWEAACERPPRRKWYISLLVAALFAATVLLPAALAPEDVLKLAGENPLVSAALLLAVQGGLMLIFLVFYLPYWGLSGLLRMKLYDLQPMASGEDKPRNAPPDDGKPVQNQETEQAESGEPESQLQEEEPQEEELRRRQGDELYREAIAGGKVDAEQIQQAAELGCRPACLYMGRQLMDAWLSGTYTREEKLEIAGFARDYFQTAAQEEHFPQSQAEGEFGRLMFETILAAEADLPDAGSAREHWGQLLAGLHKVRASGLLDEKYGELCARLIDYAEGMAKSSLEDRERGAADASSRTTPV